MSRPLIVLKYGGSVLRHGDDLATITHDIYRYLRRGYRVVAVVSAFEGETSRLLAEACAAGDDLPAAAVAELVATGESRSAARLALQLDRAGIAVALRDVAAIGLRTTGDPLDAVPQGVSVKAIQRALRNADVLVVPGFTGRDSSGQTTLLGRGGSDLTALVLARFLGARCRLIKDVAGLYEWDPQIEGPRPRLFATMPWSEARKLDGSIVQHKAIDWALHHQQQFDVAGLFARTGTRVGNGTSFRYSAGPSPAIAPLRVALLGAGTVGGGVLQHLQRLANRFNVVSVLVRDRNKHREISDELLLTTFKDVAARDFDLLVDTSGDEQLALDAAVQALQSGRHFVTANKVLVANHGRRLEQLARNGNAFFRYSACVGGGAPMIEGLARWSRQDELMKWCGVLNGTTNFVLDRLANGEGLDSAIQRARQLGFAERDADADLSGFDAACKLAILVRVATGRWTPVSQIPCEMLDGPAVDRARRAANEGRRLRQVARAEVRDGELHLRVELTEVPARSALGRCPRQWNVLVARSAAGKSRVFRGKGAGRWPTAESVISDLLVLARRAPRRNADQSAIEPATPVKSLNRAADRSQLAEAL